MEECMLRICHHYFNPVHLIWASTCIHQILLKDWRNLITTFVVLLGCGISYTAVYIWTNMSLQSSHRPWILLNSRKSMIKLSCSLFMPFGAMTFFTLSASLCISIFIRSITCLKFCRLYRAYQKLFASMHDKGIGPHKTQFRRDENYGNKMWFILHFVWVSV